MNRATAWWARPGLEVDDGRLRIAGRDAETLAREHALGLAQHVEQHGDFLDTTRDDV
jgi:hypothetical protein